MRDGTERGDGVDRRGCVERTGEEGYSRYLHRVNHVLRFEGSRSVARR